jgi:hypothetical protein
MPMTDVGSRARTQPPPPHVVFEALSDPDRDPHRPWLNLLEDERRPAIVSAAAPTSLTWSSLWTKRPDAIVVFDLSSAGDGTLLRWTLSVDDHLPDEALIGHMRKRLNQLINADLRYTFGQ